jgi:non-specific serine/threonine protein kinase
VRATVEWSYQLLDAEEQRGFRSLAVFVGSFDAPAAETIAAIDVDALVRLVDKSLVTVVETRGRPTRYRLLETVREFADGLLLAAGEALEVRARHLQHFSSLSEPTPGWPSPVAERVVTALADDYSNVRAALEWAAVNDPCGGQRLLASTGDLFSMLGHADGWRLAVELLHGCTDRDRHRVMVQITAGVIGFQRGPLDVARAMLAEALELATELGENGLRGWSLTFLGLTEVLAGRVESGRTRLETARQILRDDGARVGEARATGVLGLACVIEGDNEGARELVDAALAMCIAEDDRWGQGHLHTYLGIISEHLGDEAAATTHNRTAIECFRPFRDSSLLPTALASQASVIARRDPARALKVVAAARAIKSRAGSDFPPFFRERADQVRAGAAGAVGADADALWQEGFGLDRDEAIALAFGTVVSRPPTVSGLSGREQEVARLVADGLANKEIAARLHLSVRTVETHVRHVLTKLGLLNRTQLATWARERLS